MKMPTVPRGGNVHTDNAAGQQVHPSKLTCRFCDDILQTRYQLRQHENEHMGLSSTATTYSKPASSGSSVVTPTSTTNLDTSRMASKATKPNEISTASIFLTKDDQQTAISPISDKGPAGIPDLRYFRCMDCDKPYTRRDSLQKHFRTKHPGKQLVLLEGGKAHVGGDKLMSFSQKRRRQSPVKENYAEPLNGCRDFVINIDCEEAKISCVTALRLKQPNQCLERIRKSTWLTQNWEKSPLYKDEIIASDHHLVSSLDNNRGDRDETTALKAQQTVPLTLEWISDENEDDDDYVQISVRHCVHKMLNLICQSLRN